MIKGEWGPKFWLSRGMECSRLGGAPRFYAYGGDNGRHSGQTLPH